MRTSTALPSCFSYPLLASTASKPSQWLWKFGCGERPKAAPETHRAGSSFVVVLRPVPRTLGPVGKESARVGVFGRICGAGALLGGSSLGEGECQLRGWRTQSSLRISSPRQVVC